MGRLGQRGGSHPHTPMDERSIIAVLWDMGLWPGQDIADAYAVDRKSIRNYHSQWVYSLPSENRQPKNRD